MDRVVVPPEIRNGAFRAWMRTAPRPVKEAVQLYLGLKEQRRGDGSTESDWINAIADHFAAKFDEAGLEISHPKRTDFRDMKN